MSDYQEIAATLSEALKTAQKSSTAETVENYSLLSEQLNELVSTIGRSLKSNAGYEPLVAKLEKGTPLTEAERNTLRSLIIGDAVSISNTTIILHARRLNSSEYLIKLKNSDRTTWTLKC